MVAYASYIFDFALKITTTSGVFRYGRALGAVRTVRTVGTSSAGGTDRACRTTTNGGTGRGNGEGKDYGPDGADRSDRAYKPRKGKVSQYFTMC